ncbi:MAG: hypothetical protein R3D56_11665 [Paracoccaceae bacterium]
MSIDLSSAPFNPFLIVVAVGYAVISSEVSGPEMVRRENENAGWHDTCQLQLSANLQALRRRETVIPQVPDFGGILCSVYPELGELCQLIPDPTAAARAAQKQARDFEDARLARAATGFEGACSCAEQIFTRQQRWAVALYASSGRLLNPPVLANREAGLSQALRSPLCTVEGAS